MIQEQPKIILQGISLDEFLTKIQETLPQQISTPEKENLNVDEAAEFLGVSTPTIHRLKALDKIPFKKVGTRVIYQRSALTKWLGDK